MNEVKSMKNKGKQSVLFINMLPHIYKKILVEGYTHEQCTAWLLTEHDIDIATTTFTSYLKRHADIKLARERYNQYFASYMMIGGLIVLTSHNS